MPPAIIDELLPADAPFSSKAQLRRGSDFTELLSLHMEEYAKLRRSKAKCWNHLNFHVDELGLAVQRPILVYPTPGCFVVLNLTGGSPPTVEHADRDAATLEAGRLAARSWNQYFIAVEVTDVVRYKQAVTASIQHHSNNKGF